MKQLFIGNLVKTKFGSLVLFSILILLNGIVNANLGASNCLIKENNVIHPDSISENFIRPEHVEMNLPGNADMIKWYQKNLGFKILRQGPAPSFNSFVSDSNQHMLLELQNIKESPYFDLSGIHHMSLHFAFTVTEIEKVKEKLIAAGCKIADDLKTSNSGDKVFTLRDPWNLPIQFVQRNKHMIKFAETRLEHVAINVEDPVAFSKWFVDNLGMKLIRQGGAPSYGTFICDPTQNIMFEIYHQNYPVIDFKNVDYTSIHFAFMVDDIVKVKNILLKNGATVAEELKDTPAGDKVVMLRNPWGLPIQLVQRKNIMIK